MQDLARLVSLLASAALLASGILGELGAPAVELRPVAGARAEVLLDPHRPIDESLTLAAEVDETILRVERLFGTSFSQRQTVAIFGSSEDFARALTTMFDYGADSARSVSESYTGMFDRTSSRIAMLEGRTVAATLNVMQHELTHSLVRELSGGAILPAWFEEGIAGLSAQQQLPPERWLEEERLVGRALAASRRVSFADLRTLDAWHDVHGRAGDALYAYAAEAVRAMEVRVGWPGLVRVLRATAGGQTLEAAYLGESRETIASLEGRLVASAAVAVIVRNRPQTDDDVQWTLYNGIARAETPVAITGGRSYAVAFTVTTDELGIYRGTFGSTAQRGAYYIRYMDLVAVLDTDR